MSIEPSSTAAFRVVRANEKNVLDLGLAKAAEAINAAYRRVKYLQSERVTPQEIGQMIADPKKRMYFCLSPQGEICGSILLNEMEEDRVELGLFSIHPDYQGKKIGPSFLKCVENEAFKKAREIILKVIPLYQGPLIQFYERQGYRLTGRIEEMPEEAKTKYIRPECRDKVYFSLMNKNSSH